MWVYFLFFSFFFYRFSNIIGVLQCIQEKDNFSETYKTLLSRRYGICDMCFIIVMAVIRSLLDLTNAGNAENEVEETFIQNLKKQLGNMFTSHLEGKKIFFFLLYISFFF
jgi:hypothetical protein